MNKLKSPHLWIGVFSAIGVLSMAIVDGRKTSPGELAHVHANVPELAGRSGCADCHGGWTSSMTSACLDCHEVIAGQIDVGDGLHGMLDEIRVKKCALCHSDHHGAGFALVNPQSFRQAGVPDIEAFDHDMVGFAMEGKHLELSCDECHVNAEVAILTAGEHRFLGLNQNCASCHDDAHEGRMKLACASCHGQDAWDELSSLDHDQNLPLIGGHGEIGCRECHADDDAHSLERLGGGLAPEARSCRACHESPHRRPFMKRLAQLEGMPLQESCVVCHEPQHISFHEDTIEFTAERHACTGFALDVPHDEVTCEACHDPQVDDFRERYPGRKANDCAACHEDPHGGQFDTGPFAAQGCVGCHSTERFTPHAFTLELHAETGFELTGTHIDTECSECHTVPKPDAPRTFHGTAGRCEDCHGDAHKGFFDELIGTGPIAEASFATGECAGCHNTVAFDEVPEESFDHEAWTGFAAAGAHAQTDCETCHPLADEPNEHGRRFGWVEDHFGEYRGCVTCHVDPHRGMFDRRKFPSEIDGRTGCARCHVETSFRTFPDGFDHERWTHFPLEDAHAEAGCADCHEPLRHPDAFGRTWKRANGRGCADCHADPHQGQFDYLKDSRSCARCHQSTASFDELAFNHERHSRFQLGEAHAALACSECHATRTSEDGTEFVRYRPMGRECADCHGDNDDPFERRAILRKKGSKRGARWGDER